MSLSADDRFWIVQEQVRPYRKIRCGSEKEALRKAGEMSSDVQIIPPKSAAMEGRGHEWGEPSF